MRKFYIRIFFSLSLLSALAACGGGGGSSTSSAAPSIQNLQYTPTGAYLNDGNGTISINGSIDFSDTDADVSSYYLTVLDSSNNTIASLSGAVPASGISSGTLLISLLVGTGAVENYRFAVYIKDAQNNVSNTLTGSFPVIGPTKVTSNLPDTGADRCYNASGIINCPLAVSDAFYGQDFQYSSNPMHYTDNGDGTVSDDVTGLMWQMTPDGVDYNWYQATGSYDAVYNPTTSNVCANLTTGGYTDWRLPEKQELISLIDYGRANPAINTDAFPDTGIYDYWSNTGYTATDAWFVQFANGAVSTTAKTAGKHVQCVRGGTWGVSHFVDNGDGTVTDTVTGLMWQQTAMSPIYNWEAKLNACENLNLAGHTDWRLPDIRELATTASAGAMLIVPTNTSTVFSSSTTNVGFYDSEWVMLYSPTTAATNGQIISNCCGGNSKTLILGYTRCVR